MSKPLLKYTLNLTQVTRYDWTALVADRQGEKPTATTLIAKSLPELMAKCLIAVVLHDKNAGIAEPVENPPVPDAPIVLAPNNRLIGLNGQSL